MLLTNMGYGGTGILPRGEEVILYVEESQPDIILLDVNLKGKLDGIETAAIQSAGLARTYVFLGGIAVLLAVAFLLYRNSHQRKKVNTVLQNTLNKLNTTQPNLVARNAESELLLKEIHPRVKKQP